jgi:hypothetical protein
VEDPLAIDPPLLLILSLFVLVAARWIVIQHGVGAKGVTSNVHPSSSQSGLGKNKVVDLCGSLQWMWMAG